MHRRLWLSVAMLVTGASLLVASSFASAAGNSGASRRAGSGRWVRLGASVQVDPQLAYVTTAWWLEYATAAKLYNYPDKSGPAGSKLVPEVASNFTVSNGGKRYTFFIRKGFKFSDGTAGDREQLQVRHQPNRQPGSRVSRRAVHHRPDGHEHRRRAGGQQRPGDQRLRRHRSRATSSSST